MTAVLRASQSHLIFPLEPRPEIASLPASLIREIANGAMRRTDILLFWFGESDLVTPKFIRDATIRSLEAGESYYTPKLGRPSLREALSLYMKSLHGRAIGFDRVAVVPGGISALMLTAQGILSPGDKVVGITPLWPNVAEIPHILGATVTHVPLSIADGKWSLDVDKLIAALTHDTRMLILNLPSNPTGWTIEDDQVDAVLRHCRRYGIWIVSDDVYQRLPYDPERNLAPSFLSRSEEDDRIISVNSFSKGHGWLRWCHAVSVDRLREGIGRFAQCVAKRS
jgi:aspartate/methionine/tyrosine aminotransferase